MPIAESSKSIDRMTALCLACSSSLPPLKSPAVISSFSSKGYQENSLHITKCCQRVICPACIAANPRLARYDPCLACLGGVSAVSPRTPQPSQKLQSPTLGLPSDRKYNLDGAVRDEDTFILGDDSDEDDLDKSSKEHTLDADALIDHNPPPPYQPIQDAKDASPRDPLNVVFQEPSGVNVKENASSIHVPNDLLATSMGIISLDQTSEEHADKSAPYKYYISPVDTLLGICLRFGVDSREVCSLNKLSPSAMRTTPHLLHTRSFILLPASAKISEHASRHAGTQENAEEIRRREERLVRERAEKRLQTLTKEVDWRVAKAYVALADDPEERDAHDLKKKEVGSPSISRNSSAGSSDSACNSSRTLEMTAIEQYLDDDEWEAQERRAGRVPKAQSLPFGENTLHRRDSHSESDKRRRWWPKSG